MREILSTAFRSRDLDASKHTVGTVTIVGGSRCYAHAPAIAGLGARAAGAGLVRLVVPEASRMAAACLVPEATLADLAPGCAIPKADVLVAGMGLGEGEAAEALISRILAETKGRLVLDADGLNAMARMCAQEGGFLPQPELELVLTPHEGEAARLLGTAREKVHANRLESARELSRRYGALVVLKGPGTLVVKGERSYVNDSGNPFMALGGMGDLLSGIIGARWAYLKDDALLAAASGVWLHGAAGDGILGDNLDFSIANLAARVGSMRVALDKGEKRL